MQLARRTQNFQQQFEATWIKEHGKSKEMIEKINKVVEEDDIVCTYLHQ